MNDIARETTPKIYDFKMEEQELIKVIIRALRLLPKRPNITAEQIHLTALMLRALERMPLVTEGIGIRLDFIMQGGPEGSLGLISLLIDDEMVKFQTSEVIYQESVGSDFSVLFEHEFGIGWRTEKTDFIELEDWASWFIDLAEEPLVELSFEDFAESAIDWYDNTNGEELWHTLKSEF